jgi:hypothetical protein
LMPRSRPPGAPVVTDLPVVTELLLALLRK